MKNTYKNNPRFRAYVDKYARKHEVSIAEAMSHKIVKIAHSYYTEKEEAQN